MVSENLIERLQVGRLMDFRKIAARYGLVSSNPRFMTIVTDISNKCNLRCRMCYFSFDKYFKVEPVYLLPGQFEKMAAVLLPHAAALTLSCGNEPLTSPYFAELLKIASAYRVPHVDFATNGMLLNEEKADAVIKYGVTEVLFSVDAAKPETYELIRRGAGFDRLIKNIRYLVKQKSLLKRHIPRLRFNITLMKTNITEMEELVVLAHSLGVSQLDFRHLIIYDGLQMEEESLDHHRQLSNLHLAKAVKKAKELGLDIVAFPGYFPTGEARPTDGSYSHPSVFRRKKLMSNFFPLGHSFPGSFLEEEKESGSRENSLKPFGLKKLLDRIKTNPGYVLKTGYYRLRDLVRTRKMKYYCRLPFNYMLIDTGGGVFPCPYCHGEAPYGNLIAGSFEEIWFGDSYRELRQRIIADDPPGMCRKCPNFRPGVENRDVFQPRVVNE